MIAGAADRGRGGGDLARPKRETAAVSACATLKVTRPCSTSSRQSSTCIAALFHFANSDQVSAPSAPGARWAATPFTLAASGVGAEVAEAVALNPTAVGAGVAVAATGALLFDAAAPA